MGDVLQTVRESLVQTLQIDPGRLPAAREVRLLGSVPEFDSMAVLAVLTDLEERLEIEFDDDEISAELFETLGALTDFVDSKISVL